MEVYLADRQDLISILWPSYPIYNFGLIFFDQSKFTNSNTKSFFPFFDNYLIWIRLGSFIAMTAVNGVTMYLTDWHNDEYCWYLTNQSQWISWIASLGLLIYSILNATSKI